MMEGFLYGVVLQWKLDMRDRGVILTYYIVPIVFFVFMGGIFTSIDLTAKLTLIQSMTIFAITMGAFLGTPIPLAELYGSEIKTAYKVGGIPLGIAVINNIITGFIHLFIVSLFIFIIAPFVFNATRPNNLLLYFTVLAIFILACLLIGTVLGLFVTNTSRLTMFSQFLFLPSIMLSGIMFPSSMLPNILYYFGKVLPATWGYMNILKNNYDELNLLPFLFIILFTIIISIFKIKKLEESS